MKKEIDVEGLPEGWEPVAFRVPNIDEFVLDDYGQVWLVQDEQECKQMIVKKIQLRRIVLEETEEVRELRHGDWFVGEDGLICRWTLDFSPSDLFKIWKEVKEK